MNRQANVTQSTTYAEYRAAIDVVTSYIQTHIGDPLKLDRLADLTGFSPYHFHRIFSALTGETVAEHVRRVRLAAAVQRLMHTDKAVTEIALTAGYETPAAFTKAFRQRFGVTPTALRTMDRAAAYTILLEQPTPQPANTRSVRPEIRALPDLRILYVRGWGMVEYDFKVAADAAFTTLACYLHEQKLTGAFTACLGITPDDYDVVPHDQCRFDAGVILKDGVAIAPTENVAIQVLPAGRWAVFQHKGPYNTLWQSWNVAYRDWLPRSGERPRDVPPVEVYLNNVNNTPPEQLRTEILIPIL
jgi:AraC family transcriptional regulator